MPRDEQREDTAAWFAKAREDARVAEAVLDMDPPSLSSAAFHCQQAAEKAVKGFLVSRDVTFTKTHDIRTIADLALPLAPELEPLLDRAARLTVYAWKFRYPGDVFDPSAEEIAEAVATATEVVDTLEFRALAD